MSEDLYAKPDLSKKVRFQTSEKKENADIKDDITTMAIYDNFWSEGSTTQKPQDIISDEQEQTSSGKRNLHKTAAAAVILGLLCLLLLVGVIVLVVLMIRDKNTWNMERSQLSADNAKLARDRDELRTSYKELDDNLTQQMSQLTSEKDLLSTINNNVTDERDELQRSYDELESLRDNLTQQMSRLTSEKDLLSTINNNVTDERDELESLRDNLTQQMSRLGNENRLLKVIQHNLTDERNELQEELEKTEGCPLPWIRYKSSCYFISKNRTTWNSSKRICEDFDAHLVMISSTKEQKFIKALGIRNWIGLKREKGVGKEWKWLNGESLSSDVRYWIWNRPNSIHLNTTELCAEMFIYPIPLQNWNDRNCTAKRRYICEKMLE